MIRALLVLAIFASTAHAQRPVMRQVPAVKHRCAPKTVVVIVVKQRRPIVYYGGGWNPYQQ